MKLLEHNRIAVDKICAAFEENKDVIYVSGVGTGKSFVFMGVAERLQCDRILYVIPKYAIQENIMGYKEYNELGNKIDFVTYNFFNNIEKGIEKCAQYDMVVIDEVHHLGSDIYGKVLLSAMRKCNTKFLGLTATPGRDNGKDDVTRHFDSVIYGLSNFDAIRKGMMPKFTYRVCIPEQDLQQIEREYGQAVNIRINYSACTVILRDIATRYERNKWICFFTNVQAVEENYALIKRVFDGYEIFVLHAQLNNLKEVLDGVRNANRAVILSVNMLLEGVHLDGIDAIALFRNVTSLSAFQQMLGRVCSIGKDVSPVIADCSSSGVKLLAKLLNENHKSSGVASFPGTVRPIMDIGLGAHQEWKGIEQLMKCVELYKTKEERELERAENLKKALTEYQKFHGIMGFKTVEEIKKNKKEYAKLRACAEIHHISSENFVLYIVSLQNKEQEGE